MSRKYSIPKNGDVFNKLTVISDPIYIKKTSRNFHECRCECGKIVTVDMYALHHGKTKSCGCANKLEFVKRATAAPGLAAIGRWLNGYIGNANKRNIPFELSNEDFTEIISNKCHYCGSDPIPYNAYLKKDGTTKKSSRRQISKETIDRAWILVNGIDRIDSKLGYVKNNCVTCCGSCNEMKNDKSVTEFILHISKILNFYKGS